MKNKFLLASVTFLSVVNFLLVLVQRKSLVNHQQHLVPRMW